MPELRENRGLGAYGNLCLTVIAGCLVFLCYRSVAAEATMPKGREISSVTSERPTRVELVGISANLGNPMPCKLMYKERSGSFGRQGAEWTDDGTLRVQMIGADNAKERVQVEIVDVATGIKNALPIATQREHGGLFGKESKDEPIAVRLVGIERPTGGDKWHAIPVRGPATISGEGGGMIGSHPVEVRVHP